MKAVVLSKLQQLTGNQNYGKTCYNDVYNKSNGESVRRLKCWNYDRSGKQLINESNFKHIQNEIEALSNNQYRIELDRLKYTDMYDHIIVRIITLVKDTENVPTPAPTTINVYASVDMKDIIASYFSKDINVNVITY